MWFVYLMCARAVSCARRCLKSTRLCSTRYMFLVRYCAISVLTIKVTSTARIRCLVLRSPRIVTIMVPLFQSLETMNQFYSNVEKRMKVDGMRMNALENSVTKILQQNEKLLPQPWEFPEAITFDLDNKHKDLIISEDKYQVSLRSIPKKLLKDSKRTRAKSANILASQCFSTGRHYWEVDVAGSLNWSVGVVEKDWLKNGMGRLLGRDKRSWVLESDEGNLTVLHHNDISTVSEASVQRLGVFVDCDKGRVKFSHREADTCVPCEVQE
ncbi:ret finger protein-like 3 isoform X1 [Brachyhypopomus gauderio]|uniref:ret finger protein-like 3 isoform X1 n=2 Tax=Brachyhypopomus gauderio TaxID=698409 RepID=UPI004042A087